MKNQAYCKNNNLLKKGLSLDQCADLVEKNRGVGQQCEKGDGIFHYDPIIDGWCFCCTNKDDALIDMI